MEHLIQSPDFVIHLANCLDTESWLAIRLTSKRLNACFLRFCPDPVIMMGLGKMLGGKIESIDFTKFRRLQRNRKLYRMALAYKAKTLPIRNIIHAIDRAGPKSMLTPDEISELFGGDYDAAILEEFYDNPKFVSKYQLALLSDNALQALIEEFGDSGRVLDAALYHGLRDWHYYNDWRFFVRCPLVLPQRKHIAFFRELTGNVSVESLNKFDWKKICPKCIIFWFTEKRHLIHNPLECIRHLEYCLREIDMRTIEHEAAYYSAADSRNYPTLDHKVELAALAPRIPVWPDLLSGIKHMFVSGKHVSLKAADELVQYLIQFHDWDFRGQKKHRVR